MKYKKIMPILLIAALFLGAAYSINNKIETETAYQTALDKARDYADRGITVDSVNYFKQAMEIHPSADLALEAGERYLAEGKQLQAINWYRKELEETYPKDPRTYLFAIRAYLLNNNCRAAHQIYEEYQTRGLYLDEVEEVMDPIQYAYMTRGWYSDAGPFSNTSNTAPAVYDDHWGYVTTEDDRTVDFIYTKAGVYAQYRYAPVINEKGEALYIDENGEVRINDSFIRDSDPDFGKVVEFRPIQSGLILAYNGSIWNYYDAQTFEKRFGGYAGATPITLGIGAVSKDGQKWALIDDTGALITDFVYDEVVADEKDVVCRTDAIVVRKDDQYFLVDHSGNRISETYDTGCAFYDDSYAAFSRGRDWFFVDQTGRVGITGHFQDARSFSSGMAAVKSGGQWGYMSMKGELLIPFQFEEAGPFNKGGFFVLQNGHWTIVSLYKYNHD